MISFLSKRNAKLLLVYLGTFLISGTIFAQSIPEGQEAITQGESLFKNNCTTCHAISNDIVVGPGLKDVTKRRKTGWIINFVRNSTKLIQSGDPTAVKLYEEFNKTQMPSHSFSDDEILSILAYIKQESEAAPAEAAATATAEGGAPVASDQELGQAVSKYLDIILVVLIVLLIVMVVTLLIISTLLKNYLKSRELGEEDRELVEQKFDFSKVYKSKAVRTIVVLIFVVSLLDLALDKALGVGIQQGYQPKQPIAFSHKLHAGEHKIDCNYCHTTAYKGKSASIPSVNICMNCHSQIKKESPEIQKIYRAVEKNRPIEWVRIHNLPDLAYFNHAQHTQVGGVECQTCHGPIQEMEVVSQYSPLTMGWCIDCHRTREINTKDNGYYDNLVKLHESKTKAPFTVVSNGGAECSKCHY